MGNRVSWFDVISEDMNRSAAFYGELFGWHTEKVPDFDYILIDTHSGAGINGGIATVPPDRSPYSLFYAGDPDIKPLLDKAVSLGATVVVPASVSEMVTFAQFADPWGNVVGLVQGEEEQQQPVSTGDNPPVDWFELTVPDAMPAWEFYRSLFGW